MKQKFASWFVSLLFIAIVSGCAQPVQGTPTLFPIIPTASVTETVASKTATPTLTPSTTHTPIPVTPTDVPTLLVEDARQRLLDLLTTNGNCQLPCLQGITPGESNYLDARSVLLPLRGIAETAYFDFTSSPVDDISPIYIEGDTRLATRVAYVYEENGVVSYIVFRAVEQQLSKDEYGNTLHTPIFDSPTFLKRVQYYSLSHVLSEQGIPDFVMIQAFGSLVDGFMDIVLLYPRQGIWVDYKMVYYATDAVKGGCPTNAYMEMNLYPSGDPDGFYTFLDQTDWDVMKSGYRSIEEATSMSVEQFYETFRQPTNMCIESPLDLWPDLR